MDLQEIVEHCAKRLRSRREKWLRILKTLFLIEHILKTGNIRFIDSIKGEEYRLKSLQTFSYIDENRADKGESSKIYNIIIIIININYIIIIKIILL